MSQIVFLNYISGADYRPWRPCNGEGPQTHRRQTRCLKIFFSARNSDLFCNFLLFGGILQDPLGPIRSPSSCPLHN